MTPIYEIWISRHLGGGEFGIEEFAEDCCSLYEARIAAKEYQEFGDAAWIQDKETGEMVKGEASK